VIENKRFLSVQERIAKIPAMSKMPQPPNEMQPPSENDGFNVWDPEILSQIDALVNLAHAAEATEDNRDLVRQIIVTALKGANTGLDRGDMKILSRSLRELRYGFGIFKEYRGRRKVTIFGSARTDEHDPDYVQALEFARRMAQKGFMSITGAGPGIMQAGNQGAGPNNSFGINIRLPFEQAANEFIVKDPRFIDCRFFFTRKLMFLKETSAVAFFPGGFGTHDEAMETLTLVQTGKSNPMPIVFVDSPDDDYWKEWHEYIVRHLLKRRKISPEDLGLYKITDRVDEAVDEITNFYRNYHSMRFVKDLLVLRLRQAVPADALEALNKDFSDICVKGGFTNSGPLSEEHDWTELPRLVFQFDRLHFGRLRALIDRVNQIPGLPTPTSY
jgi:uncharacterized protein (TIGR00730 family)